MSENYCPPPTMWVFELAIISELCKVWPIFGRGGKGKEEKAKKADLVEICKTVGHRAGEGMRNQCIELWAQIQSKAAESEKWFIVIKHWSVL